MAKLSFLLGAATGYVLGARAGKQRYAQIKTGAAQLWQSKPVQQQVEQAKHAAKTKAAPAALDAVSTAATVAGDKMRQGAGRIKNDPDRDVSSQASAPVVDSGASVPLEGPGSESEWADEGGAVLDSGSQVPRSHG